MASFILLYKIVFKSIVKGAFSIMEKNLILNNFSTLKLLFARRVTYAPCYSLNWHSIPENQLFFILSGAMTLELPNGLNFHATAGDTLFLPANTIHHDKFYGKKGPELLHVRLTLSKEESFFEELNPDFIQKFPFTVRSDIAAQFKLLNFPQDRTDGTFNSEYQKSRITLQLGVILYLCLEELYEKNYSHNDNDRVRYDEAKRYIADQIETHLTLEKVANHMKISSRTLARIFRRCSGESFHNYLQQHRLNEAKRLLSTGKIPISEVAQQLGFCDAGYLGKVFKKHFGFTPGQFK